jgi:hypothetical protein
MMERPVLGNFWCWNRLTSLIHDDYDNVDDKIHLPESEVCTEYCQPGAMQVCDRTAGDKNGLLGPC